MPAIHIPHCTTPTQNPRPTSWDAPGQERPPLSQKTKQVDLEGGVRLLETIGESEDSEVWLNTARIYRNGEMVLLKGWTNFAGKNATGRSLSQLYYHKGKLVLLEADQDGDGAFDLLILFDDAENPVQAFDVKKDALLSPVSKERLKKIKQDLEVRY